MLRSMLTTKTLGQLQESEEGGGSHSGQLTRSLRTLDLLAIGVGSTVGTGVFSITGQVARTQAGPAVALCWLLGGLGCALSAVSYIELSARLPVTGSVYAFAYHALGEVFAVVAAACITLEYGISASAVAANWGEKLMTFLESLGAQGAKSLSLQMGHLQLSAPALLLLILVTAMIARGGAMGKAFTRGSSALAVLLILGMTCVAFTGFEAKHFSPFLPPERGARGLFSGCVTTFFGFLGYDEVCCLAGEAVEPRRSVPKAVLGTILVATLLPVLGSLSLVGLVRYEDIDASAGFEVAFKERGWTALSHAVSVGELLVLFVVTYMCFLAQPRIFYALAKDGLMPASLRSVDESGRPLRATYVTGVILILCGALLPFDLLANAISGGVLVAFDLVNCCLLILRHKDATASNALVQGPQARPIGGVLCIYTLSSAFGAYAIAHGSGGVANAAAAVFFAVALVALAAVAARLKRAGRAAPCEGDVYFTVPGVPWVPALAIAFNNVMLASLEPRDFALLAGYLLVVVLAYLVLAWRR